MEDMVPGCSLLISSQRRTPSVTHSPMSSANWTPRRFSTACVCVCVCACANSKIVVEKWAIKKQKHMHMINKTNDSSQIQVNTDHLTVLTCWFFSRIRFICSCCLRIV